MSVIRAFIAVDLSPEIRQCLQDVTSAFNQQLRGLPVRWVPAHNIHLTLKFLGDVSLANLEILKNILQTEVLRHHCFEFSVGGVGAFPSARRPRVIWVGVEAPSDLGAVQSGIEAEMACLGYASEERPFSPHLTLGRVSRSATPEEVHKIGATVEKMKVGFLGVARVREVSLYRSDLQPGGAVYTCIFSTPLAE